MPSGLLSAARMEYQADLPWGAWAGRTPQPPQLGRYGVSGAGHGLRTARLSVFSGRAARNGSTSPRLNSAVPPREPGNRMRPPHESTGRLSLHPLPRKVKIEIPPLITAALFAKLRLLREKINAIPSPSCPLGPHRRMMIK